MKALLNLLALIMLQTSLIIQINTCLYAGAELPEGTSSVTPVGTDKPNLSFEDFLKQLESQNPENDLDSTLTQDPQDKDLKDSDEAKIKSATISNKPQSPFLFDMPKRTKSDNQTKNLEQEIINLLNQKITPLANDLSKIVQGPDLKKALDEKKKQRELEEKEAARKIEQMKLKRPSGYSPSYRPSSGYSGSGWNPSKGRSSGYGSGGYGSGGYGGYSPSSSYWDKYKGDDALGNKKNDKTLTTGKDKDDDKKKSNSYGSGKSGGNKEIKKAINSINGLTTHIQSILTRELARINNPASVQELATGETLVELNKLFKERQHALAKIPETSRTNTSEVKTNDIEKEKSMWKQFAPQIVKAVTFNPDSRTEAQKAGRSLLSALRADKYIPESAGQIPGEAAQKHSKKDIDRAKDETDTEEKLDPTLNQVRYFTQIIKNFIAEKTKGLKPRSEDATDIDKNNAIYQKLATENFFTELLKLLNQRQSKLNNLPNPTEVINSKEEKEIWDKFLPTLIQVVTYTDTDENPNDIETKKMYKNQTQGKIFMEQLKIRGYVDDKMLSQKQKDFEAALKKTIKPTDDGDLLDKATSEGIATINKIKKAQKLFGNIVNDEIKTYFEPEEEEEE